MPSAGAPYERPYITYLDSFLLLHYVVLSSVITAVFAIRFLQRQQRLHSARWLLIAATLGLSSVLCWVEFCIVLADLVVDSLSAPPSLLDFGRLPIGRMVFQPG